MLIISALFIIISHLDLLSSIIISHLDLFHHPHCIIATNHFNHLQLHYDRNLFGFNIAAIIMTLCSSFSSNCRSFNCKQ